MMIHIIGKPNPANLICSPIWHMMIHIRPRHYNEDKCEGRGGIILMEPPPTTTCITTEGGFQFRRGGFVWEGFQFRCGGIYLYICLRGGSANLDGRIYLRGGTHSQWLLKLISEEDFTAQLNGGFHSLVK